MIVRDIGRDTAMPIGVNLSLKALRNIAFTLSLDPPKSPLRRGVGVDFEKTLVPPFLRGVRGDLRLRLETRETVGLTLS